MHVSYGTSCFLQILDEEPAPLDHESRQEELQKERIARAQEKRQLFLQQLAFKQYCLKHDHSYSCTSDKFSPAEQHKEIEYKSQVILNDLYIHHVSIDSSTILELEATTRGQSKSEKWVFERKLRITASVMKQVCHHRPSTSCDSFVKRKLSSSPISVPAIEYGRKNEQLAISSYLNYHKANGKIIQVESCGLFVDHRKSWLAASPDAVVTDFSDVDNLRGCLEVKCPHVCESRSIKDACREVKGFCLTDSKGLVQLCRSHMYYYQVQTQMQVTGLRWCDFFIWSPVAEPFVERIAYDETFMDESLQKAEAFYFNKFLPSIASYLIIQPSSCDIVMSKSVLCCRTRTMGTDNSHDYNTETMIAEKAVDGSNSAGNMTMKLCSAKGDIKPDSVCNPCITLDGTSVAEPKSDFMDRTENTVSIPKKQDISMECQNTEKCYEKDPNRKEVKPRATTEVKPGTASADLQLMTVYSKPLMCVNNLQALLKHLGLKKHSVKADGNCLYHAVAHQAELITKCSTGDELVSRHLRHLVFLTMVTYSNVRLETSMSPTEWLEKQKQVLTPEKWGGDFELRLMAIGLKRDIIVITDSTTGSAFGRRFPKEPPPVEKMKGGCFCAVNIARPVY